jgi:hypothetical protein
MLRITPVAAAGPARVFRLEGKLLAPWVEEVRRTCGPDTGGAAPCRLDLSAVTFVDAAGADLLRDLRRQAVWLTPCSGYLIELLHPEGP